MNETENYTVSTIIDCDNLSIASAYEGQSSDPLWWQAALGCQVLNLLQDLYQFNVTYVHEDITMNITDDSIPINTTLDLFARPMAVTPELLDRTYPIIPVFTWRLGFLLRRPPNHVLRSFYSQPFTRRVWDCLYLMTIFIAPFLYFMCWCEKRLLGLRGRCSLGYELLIAIGAFCQHYLPVQAKLQARRLSYFVFFLFSYLIYAYYGSVLLSHLVNEKGRDVTLEELINSDYEYVFPGDRQEYVNGKTYGQYSSIIENRLKLRPANHADIVKAIMTQKTAVLSDFESVYPFLKREMNNDELCKLIEIDVYSNIKKYFFVAKNFPLKEKFKISYMLLKLEMLGGPIDVPGSNKTGRSFFNRLLRAKEAGIFNRLWSTNSQSSPLCSAEQKTIQPQTRFMHVLYPIIVLLCTYILSVILMIAERVHYRRQRVYPFVN